MSALANTALSRLRPMMKADLKEVMAIELRAYDFPWNKGIFWDCIRAGYRCRVLEVRGYIGSYGVMSVGAEEAHILNLCVRPEWRRRGLARRMLDELLELARVDGAREAFLEVRPSNDAALRLYRTTGFTRVGVRRAYYPAKDGREDAWVMAKGL